jgi:hypothetical protein
MNLQSVKSKLEIKQLKDALWWVKTTGEGLVVTFVTFAPEILGMLPKHTLLFKFAVPLGFLLKFLRMRKEYKKDVLPSGVTTIWDKVPDVVTGEKGSIPPEDLTKPKG